MSRILVIVGIIVVLTGGFFWIKNLRFDNSISKETTKVIALLPTPSPTLMPFYDLTIPYLREREYKSSLGELKKVSENQKYSSYLTSYTSDGLKINGLLTIPKDEGKHPAIVFVHGYVPPKNYKTTENYSSYVDYLSSNGFVVFKIDLRGHGSSEGEASGGYFSSDYVIDILNAYAALKSADFVDPNSIGLWGHSMGGNVVMRAFVSQKDIKALIIWAGAVYTYDDFYQYGISDNSYRPLPQTSEAVKKRQELFETYGSPNEGNPFWQQVAPTNYLDNLPGAISLNHTTNDKVVSIEYSRNLNNILNKTSIPHELNEYSSGGHNITGASFTQAMQNTVEFFYRYLKLSKI